MNDTKLKTFSLTTNFLTDPKMHIIGYQHITQTTCSPLAARTSHNHLHTNKLHSTHISPKIDTSHNMPQEAYIQHPE